MAVYLIFIAYGTFDNVMQMIHITKDYTVYHLSEIKFFYNKGIAIFWHLNVQWLSQYIYMIYSISFMWDIGTTQKDFREDLIRQKKDPSKSFNSDLFIIFTGMSSFTKRRISLYLFESLEV